jgi:hypothetical protein
MLERRRWGRFGLAVKLSGTDSLEICEVQDHGEGDYCGTARCASTGMETETDTWQTGFATPWFPMTLLSSKASRAEVDAQAE